MNPVHMAEQVAKVRKRARPWRSIIAMMLAVLAAAGSVVARRQADSVRAPDDPIPWQLIAAGCAAAFCVFAFAATLGLSGRARHLLTPRVGSAHAAMVRLLLVLAGGLTTLVLTLEMFSLPVGQLVLGGALTGVLVGIAAQQTLANLFAGIILLLSRPFMVGDDVRLWSGPLGGVFEGTVLEIGLTYVRLEAGNGEFRLPNAQVLSSAVGPRADAEPRPETTPPETTAPETTAPLQTTAPDPTAPPETTVPDTTVPETTGVTRAESTSGPAGGLGKPEAR